MQIPSLGGRKNVNPLRETRNLKRLTSLNEDVNVGQGTMFSESRRSKGKSGPACGPIDEKWGLVFGNWQHGNGGLSQEKEWGVQRKEKSEESACNAGDPSSVPGLGWSPEERNGNPLQYSCLGNPMNPKGAWWATVHGSQESDTTEQLHPHHHHCYT